MKKIILNILIISLVVSVFGCAQKQDRLLQDSSVEDPSLEEFGGEFNDLNQELDNTDNNELDNIEEDLNLDDVL